MGAKNVMKLKKEFALKIPYHTCWYQKGKICYDKRGAITAKNFRYKKTGLELRIYWCDKCNFWHLTKKEERIYFMAEQINEDGVEFDNLPANNQPIPNEQTTENQSETAQEIKS